MVNLVIHKKRIAEQGRKAMYALNNICKKHCFNTVTKLSIFDTYVNSVMSYACEIWGFHPSSDVEKVHLSFCKNILGVHKKTSNDMIYAELGRYPLNIIRKFRIFKYWMKLVNSDNCILKNCYENMVENEDIWLVNIRRELNTIGLGYIWNLESIGTYHYNIIVKRISDIYLQSLYGRIAASPKCNLYRYLTHDFKLQSYLFKAGRHTKELTQIRLSAHKLQIEYGRYRNIDRQDRKCTLCNLNDVEDEFHFILKCPVYNDLRNKYIKSYYRRRPSMFKLIELLNVDRDKEINNLCKFLYAARKLRHNLLQT